MTFSKKIRNRRLGRESVLDVKLRSSVVRRARIRLATVAVSGLLGAVFGMYLVWKAGDWLLTRLVFENSAFAIQQFDVQTDGVIAVSQLCRWAGLQPHQNLLAMDLGRIKRNLELVPMIQTVSVERVLPRTLRVRVSERDPVAQVTVLRQRLGGALESTLFQLDAEGYVMLPLELRQRAVAAPVEVLPDIAGMDPRELQPGRRIDLPQLQAALQLIIAFQQSPMVGLVDLKSIDISAAEILTVKTGQASEVVFGLADLEQQLRRWRAVYDLGQKLGKVIATLDLAVPNCVPATWQEPNALPPAAPKMPKPLRSRSKHV